MWSYGTLAKILWNSNIFTSSENTRLLECARFQNVLIFIFRRFRMLLISRLSIETAERRIKKICYVCLN